MLSFLHNLGVRSLQMPTSKIGSDFDGSTSPPVKTRNALDHSSNSVLPTPQMSNTDGIFTSRDGSGIPESQGRRSERLRCVRSSIGNYNENVLSGSARKSTQRKVIPSNDQPVSSDVFVNSDDDEHRQSVPSGVQLSGLDQNLRALPGEDPNQLPEGNDAIPRRRSTRNVVVEKANIIAKNTRSILGKRSRENVYDGIGERQNAARANENFLKSEHGLTSPLERPPNKRARVLNTSDSSFVRPSSGSEGVPNKGQKSKRWLGQGLYVGQDRDFDPRLTEAKNRLKRLLHKGPNPEHRAMLPLPMFAGQRMLEIGRNFKLPFDIFSPLPPGQPKPEEWKKTHKNVFVGDAASVWKKSKRLESSRCVCTPDCGCDETCFNRFMFYECDDSNCNIGADFCTNRSFEGLRKRIKAGGKYNIGVEVIKTVDRGHGVRSNRTFEPNEIIVEYTGEIITQDECDNRMRKRYKDSECYYLMDFDQNMILDATRGSIARFVNHSCEPNCKMIKWTVAGKPRMALFAGDQGIMTGEELTYDYNFNPYSVKNLQECRCGALSCRGFLGPKPKEIKDALKPLTVGGKRKFQQALEDSLDAVTKKRKIAVPASAKNALATVVANVSKKLNNPQILKPSSSPNKNNSTASNTKSLTNSRSELKPKSKPETKPPSRTIPRVKNILSPIRSRLHSRSSAGIPKRSVVDKTPRSKTQRPVSQTVKTVRTTRLSSSLSRSYNTRASIGKHEDD